MTIVDEAMARLARDRPEMSRESMAYVRGLVGWAVEKAKQRPQQDMEALCRDAIARWNAEHPKGAE